MTRQPPTPAVTLFRPGLVGSVRRTYDRGGTGSDAARRLL